MGKRELTQKHRLFAQFLAGGFEPHKAAIKAGYDRRLAKRVAVELIQNKDVMALVEKIRREREHKVDITFNYVLKQLKEMLESMMVGEPVMDKSGRVIDYVVKPTHAQAAVRIANEINSMMGYNFKDKEPTEFERPQVNIKIEGDNELRIVKPSEE